jgi:hypothetical protein
VFFFGVAESLTTATLRVYIYSFMFKKQGLMAGLAREGSKITKIK